MASTKPGHAPGNAPTASPIDTALLSAALRGLNIDLGPGMMAAFERYATDLVAWNARFNLTRIEAPDEIAVRHIADSLACLLALPESRYGLRTPVRCIDIGSGTGLPGLAVRIARPAWCLTLVEATAKKTAFLEHAVRGLGLANVTIATARAEDLGREAGHRATYQVAFARAVAELRVTVEYALPLLAIGGRLVALKGRDAVDEATGAAGAVTVLGGRVAEMLPYRLPGVDGERHVVVVDKIRETPAAYPRRPGVPAKRPL